MSAAPAIRPVGAICRLLACALTLGATACSSLSYPDAGPPAAAPATESAIPAATATADAAWTTFSAEGRNAMRVRDYAAAEQAYLAALAATETLPVHDTRIRTALGNVVRVAAARQTQDEWAAADRLLDVVIAEAERGRLASFETTAPVLSRQAIRHVRSGAIARATRLYETALVLHGVGDPASVDQRLEIEFALGHLYLGASRVADAEPLLVAAWRGLQSRRGPDSLEASRAGIAVAELRRAQGDLEAADRAYTRSLDVQARSIADSLEYAVNQSRLASVRLALGRDDDAARLAASSLTTLDREDAHPALVITTLDTLGTAETRLGARPAARAHFARALALYDAADSLMRAEYADLLLHIAELERADGDPLDADALLERAARERAGGRLPD